jgi:glycosyltransferase involved in cell wall biosynthesis
MDKKIHFHSDCSFFAGCENMLAVLFNSERLHKEYQVSFSFAHSALYVQGFEQQVEKRFPIYAFTFPAFTDHYKLSNCIPLLIRKATMACIRLILNIPLIIYEVIVLYVLFRKINPDILHINNGGYPAARSSLAAAIAGKLAAIPSILMVVNNMAVDYKHYSRWFDYPLDRLVVKSVDLFITGSKAAAVQLRSVLDLPINKTISLHNGIANRLSTENLFETRTRLGLSNFDGVIFGVVALLIPRKGHQVLLDAILEISKQVGNGSKCFKVLIEGKGPLREELISFVNANALNEYVEFVGDEKNIVDFMAMLDVLILPSVADEDFPNVVLEAMALGKPVIASRLAGTPEQVSEGATGFLTDPRNVEQLAQAITELSNNAQLRLQMGSAAFNKFQNFFTAEASVENYLTLYQSFNRVESTQK